MPLALETIGATGLDNESKYMSGGGTELFRRTTTATRTESNQTHRGTYQAKNAPQRSSCIWRE